MLNIRRPDYFDNCWPKPRKNRHALLVPRNQKLPDWRLMLRVEVLARGLKFQPTSGVDLEHPSFLQRRRVTAHPHTCQVQFTQDSEPSIVLKFDSPSATRALRDEVDHGSATVAPTDTDNLYRVIAERNGNGVKLDGTHLLRFNVEITGPPTLAAKPPPAVVGPCRLKCYLSQPLLHPRKIEVANVFFRPALFFVSVLRVKTGRLPLERRQRRILRT